NPYMNFDYGPGSTAGSLLVTYLENINDTTVPPLDSCRPFVQNWCSTDTASKAYCLCNTSGTSAQNQKTSQLASAAAATTELTPAQYQVQNKFTYTFTLDLWRGQEGTEVRALQEALTAQGLYDSEITGGFFDRTLAAVLAFQTKYGINPIGYVGPATRAQLNALFSN
ncbi:MAG TPA: peptidoglycan-binding domain-containing protein, partial [Candidatus Paceibacterota bacterium]